MDNNMFSSGSEKGTIRGWAEKITAEVKSAFGIQQESSVMRDEVGKYLSMGVAQGLAQNDKLVVEAFNGMLDKLKYQRKFDLISEDEYYRSLESLRDRYFTAGTENWVKYTEQIYAYQQKLLKEEQKRIEEYKKLLEQEKKSITGMYADVGSYAEQRLDAVIKKQQSMQKQLSESGRLFKVNTALINGVNYTYYSLGDLDADLAAVNKYGDMLEKLRTRAEDLGIPTETVKKFFDVLKGLDLTDANGVFTALDYTSDADFGKFIAAWSEKDAAATRISTREYKDEFDDAVDDAYKNMTEALTRAGYEIPEGFYVSGSMSAQKFGEGFAESLDKYLAPAREIISEFNSQLTAAGAVYNTSNTSYNITADSAEDIVEQIKRHDTVRRLVGLE